MNYLHIEDLEILDLKMQGIYMKLYTVGESTGTIIRPKHIVTRKLRLKAINSVKVGQLPTNILSHVHSAHYRYTGIFC